MLFFVLGVVVGGLALWVYMREHALRLEAEIEKARSKKSADASSAPAVKTRKVGEGSSKTTPKEQAPEPDVEEESVDDEDEAEEDVAEDDEEADEEDEDSDDEAEVAEAAQKPKKPAINLKLPEPSSVSEASDEEE